MGVFGMACAFAAMAIFSVLFWRFDWGWLEIRVLLLAFILSMGAAKVFGR